MLYFIPLCFETYMIADYVDNITKYFCKLTIRIHLFLFHFARNLFLKAAFLCNFFN